MNIGKAKREAAALLVCGFSAVSGLFAQTTGDLRGSVKDPSGLVIPGANVKATLEGTSTSRTASSDAKGDFVLPSLRVGRYTVESETAALRKFTRHVDIRLAHVVVVAATMKTGKVAQSVTAEAEA